MIAETGHYALILALALAIVQTVLPLWGTRTRDPQLMAVAAPAAQMQFVLIAIAFSALMTAYVTSDFSLQNVWANSHSAKPLIYKIAGVWGNHEGSMVLWVLILALVRRRGRDLWHATCRASCKPMCSPCRARSPRPFSSSSSPRQIPSSGSIPRRSTGKASTRCCRTRRSPSTRRSSTRAMSASRWLSPSPSPP